MKIKISMYRFTIFLFALTIASLIAYTYTFGSNYDGNFLTRFKDKKYNYIKTNAGHECSVINKHYYYTSVIVDGVRYPKFTPLYQNKRFNFDCMNKINKKPKTILFWTTWFGNSTFSYGLGKSQPFMNNKCPVTNCEMTDSKDRLADSDLVVFHMRDSIEYLPPTRNPNQRWVFLLYESPVHSSDFRQYNNLFNLTATYKLNSDFTSLYYETDVIWGINDKFNENQDFTLNKTEFAVIVVSNCGASSRRLDYIREMQQVIPVNIIGACGQPCPETFDNGTEAECKQILAYKYKFYLAFENSICKDYITEKFFYILRFNIIPVVYGGGTYEAHIPKSGFINALDYETPQDLAKYLRYLDSNKTAYNEYFKWKKYIQYSSVKPHFVALCEMCIQLNLDEQFGVKKKKAIRDLHEFWSNKSNCKRVKENSFSFLSY